MRFEPKRPIRIADDQILEEIRQAVKHYGGRVPATAEFSRIANISIATLRDRFGSYAGAVAQAGFVYVNPNEKYTAESILADLRKILVHTGGSRFSFKGYKQYGGVYALQTIMNCLGVKRWDDVVGVVGAADRPRVLRAAKSSHGERRRADLSDDDLLNEIGRIWHAKGRRPTSTEFRKESLIDGEAYRLRFGSWPNAIEQYCNKAGVKLQQKSGTHVTKALLLEELIAVCGPRPNDLITYEIYREKGGTYSKGPFFVHFGSWLNAVKAVGRASGTERKYSLDQLFDEMQRLWEDLEQQPTWREMLTRGNISPKVYERAFGSWKKAVQAFCNDRNNSLDTRSGEETAISVTSIYPDALCTRHVVQTPGSAQVSRLDYPGPGSAVSNARPNPRFPSQKLRFKVFVRDNFSCRFCGRTHKSDQVRMMVDHIIPYSKGGKTLLDNLQLLCEDCNLGKSNEMPLNSA